MTSPAHCDVTKKLSHAWAGINRSQTPGACLVYPGVRDNTIPCSAELRLEPFYPPWVAGIDLPHQGVVDSYSLQPMYDHKVQVYIRFSKCKQQEIIWFVNNIHVGCMGCNFDSVCVTAMFKSNWDHGRYLIFDYNFTTYHASWRYHFILFEADYLCFYSFIRESHSWLNNSITVVIE